MDALLLSIIMEGLGCFVSGCFVPMDVLRSQMFCLLDVFPCRMFCPAGHFPCRTFCPTGRFVPPDVFSGHCLITL
jgi:hypothetical protein